MAFACRFAKDAPGERKKILIAIFQRGAVDGLNVVIPHGEPAYYTMRPSIGIPRPNGNENSAIDLDGHFGLHPALRSLKPLWDKKQLAIVEAVGSPDPTRSHFDAQDYMESGTPGLDPNCHGHLREANEALAVNNVSNFQVKDGRAASLFESMYGTSAERLLNGTAREIFNAVRTMQSIQKSLYTPANNVRYPNGRLGQSLLAARTGKRTEGESVYYHVSQGLAGG